MRVGQRVLNLLFPDDCHVCGVRLTTASRIPVCASCLRVSAPLTADFFCITCHAAFFSARPLDEEGRCGLCRTGANGFDRVYAYGAYDGQLRRLIHLFKFGKVQTLATPLGNLLTRALPRDEQIDLIVPMPLHWRRRWSRGFNQSELLAQQVARRYGLPVTKALQRRRSTAAQSGLSRHQRRANVAGAFVVSKPERVKGRTVLLIDDVLTTGATASACARALRTAGAKRIIVLTVARADRRQTAVAPEGAPVPVST